MTANTLTAPALLKPRDYQTECIRAIHTRWDAGVTRPASVLPTGAGKTVVFSHLAEEYLAKNPTKRVLILSHTEELGDQAAAKMRQVAPHRTVGIVRAQRNEVTAQVISASVQTLRTAKRRDAIRNVGLIIVDECHHAVAPTYLNILRHYGALPESEPGQHGQRSDCTDSLPCPRVHCLVAGFTATLVRADERKLAEVWEDVAYRKDIAFMIRRGYLLDVKGRRVVVPDLDLKKVKTSGGDYQEGSLAEALVEAFAPEVVAKAYLEHAADRKGIGFSPTVDAAYAFSDAFQEEGIKSEVVHGALPKEERRAILARLHDGTTRVVWSCMALTEGFDEPTVSCAVIARPTKSTGLYQQMVGRVLRPDLTLAPAERGHALVLDVVGISRQHNLRSLVDLSEREDLQEKDLEELEELSLLELEDWTEELDGLEEPEEYYRGPVDVEDFDPLARESAQTWGRTSGGIYWMPAGSHTLVFLAESLEGEPGTYDVVWCSSADPFDRSWPVQKKLREGHGEGPYAGMTEYRGLPFEMALSWAEEEAIVRGGYGAKTLAAKSARWRKEVPTSGQKYQAKRLGIQIPTGADGEPLWTKGELSDAIGSVMAERRIDPLVAMVQASRQK